MTCSEFENILRTHIENTVDGFNKEKILDVHPNFLVRGFYDDQQKFSFQDLVNIHSNSSLTFDKKRFTNRLQGLSQKTIETVLLSFGVALTIQDKPILDALYAFYSTRTALVHTNLEDVQKTTGDLEQGLVDMEKALELLQKIIKI
jgi:hypothetical protein